MSKAPRYSMDVPFVPMNFQDRDVLVGRLMEILEAVLPEGKQLDATKNLVKKSVTEHFIRSFNESFEDLKNQYQAEEDNEDYPSSVISPYIKAMWETAQSHQPVKDTPRSPK